MNYNESLKLIEEMKYYIESDGEKSKKVANILKRVKEIQELLSEKFSLVFVADKGVGKTSIINYILELTYERERKTKRGGKMIVHQDVLETGAGATTTAETEIVQSIRNYSEIEIVPMSKDEIEDLLRSFAKYIFKEVNSEFKNNGVLAPELFRAIRNMTKLKESENENGEKVDLAKELAKRYSKENYILFEDEVLRRANIEYRIRTEFIITAGEEEKRSIRSIFNKINLMNIDNIPLPKKVIVKLRKEIFNFDTLGFIDKIIDTRGLDGGIVATDRRDIREIFKKDKNKIVVLVDRFNSPSQSIMKLIDTYIHDEDNETMSRILYLVNFQDGEPENVVSYLGKIDSELSGISTKCSDIHKYIKGNNINLKLDNIIFANSKRYLDPNGRIKLNQDDLEDYGDFEEASRVKKEIRLEKKIELVQDIYKIVKSYRGELIRELDSRNEEFKSIKNKDIEELNLDFDRVIDTIKKFEMDNKGGVGLEFVIFEEYILGCHHSTLMALNNRYGIYSNRDLYLVGSDNVEKIFRNRLKDVTIDAIKSVLCQVSSEEDKKKVAFIIRDIKSYYITFMDEINNFVYEYLKNSLFNENKDEFWNKLNDRWGKGSGYINDICNYYKKELKYENFDKYIEDGTNEWVKTYKNGLITVIAANK